LYNKYFLYLILVLYDILYIECGVLYKTLLFYIPEKLYLYKKNRLSGIFAIF